MRSQFGYLLLQLAAGVQWDEDGPGYVGDALDAVNKNGHGIVFWLSRVSYRGRRVAFDHRRICFSLAGSIRDDEQAQQVAEGVLLLVEAYSVPMFDLSEHHLAFPFRLSQFRRMQHLTKAMLLREVDRCVEELGLIGADSRIESHIQTYDAEVSSALAALPIYLRNRAIRFAVACLSQARQTFHVSEGELAGAIHDGDWIPSRVSDLVRWESAFHVAYKCVEAIVGDPPKDERRYVARLKGSGVDPDAMVGYRVKERVADVIRSMNVIRDSKVAHGSTPKRGVKMHEMIEFQECARYVLQCAIARASQSNNDGR